ncbi:hypothetical protein [Sphingobacterium psychroaquaticum]|uniref:Uncharacterized protein n=1 Tax=Sphingobacterium psychroaquaticum TaxID=561061 RepID=A0A1X7K3I2_9SPHI|nr:hypothetical protein [Sphingobacterium psychroaquaticum]SMG35360.1 hypothetical protein SAMN05660862_2516 [Sphingobacterium psychroaquaticum]
MYYINGLNIEQQFGLVASQIPGGNMAISGAWDMPARTGKIFHDWGDENGIEPYLRSDEIFFGGRDINFYAFMKTASRKEAIINLENFYNAIDTDRLIDFTHPGLGNWSVYINSEVVIKYHYMDNIAEINFTFREPLVVFPVVEFPIVDNSNESIDNLSWEQLGVTLLTLENDLDRPTPKIQKTTSYGNEVFYGVKRSFRELAFKGVINQPSFNGFKAVINRLYTLFSLPNARTLRMPDGTVREVFVKDGFQITNMQMESNGVIAEIDIKFVEVGQLQEYNKLTDQSKLLLVDQYGQPLSEIIKKF